MAEYTTKYSPMHIDCTIGQPYGNPSSSYTCGFHTGVDFPQSRSFCTKSRFIFNYRWWWSGLCI